MFDRLYLASKARVAEIARSLTAEQLAASVPGTPEWSGKDVVAHLAGVAADVAAGRMDGAPGPTWTAPQVQSRRGRTVDQLLVEWDEAGPALATAVAERRAGLASVFDMLTHECDLREAYRLPKPPEADIAAALDGVLRQFVKGYAGTEGGLLLRAGHKEWRLGFGEPRASVEISPYELFRALFSRRSRTQIRDWPWQGDPAEYLDRLPVFGPRDDDQPVPA